MRQKLIEAQIEIIANLQTSLNSPNLLCRSLEDCKYVSETLLNFISGLNKLEGETITMALSQETFSGLLMLIQNRNESKKQLEDALALVVELQNTDAANNAQYEAVIADLRAQLEAAISSNSVSNQQLADIAEAIRVEDEELAANNPPVEPSPVEPVVE